MNTKGIKFLAVLAVLAMAFAACAVLVDTQGNDAGDVPESGIYKDAAGTTPLTEGDYTVAANTTWYVIGETSFAYNVAFAKDANAKLTLAMVTGAEDDIEVTVDEGKNITVSDGCIFEVSSDISMIVVGTVTNNGTINNNGFIKCAGGSVIVNEGTITNLGVLGIEYVPTFTLTNPISVKNGGSLVAYDSDDKSFKGVMESYMAGEGSEFTYGNNDNYGIDITTVSGTTYVDGVIYPNWELTVGASTIVNVPETAVLKVMEGGNLAGVATSTINVEKGGFITNESETAFGGKINYAGKEATIADAANNAEVKTAIDGAENAAVITISGGDVATDVVVGKKNVALNIDGAVSKLNFEVAEGGSIAFKTNGAAKYSGEITLGEQTVTMTNVQGNFTLTPGSVIIDGEISGTLEVDDGVELVVKEKLVVTGETTISLTAEAIAADGEAELFVADDALVILKSTLTVNAGISVGVSGYILDGKGEVTGILKVNDLHVFSDGAIGGVKVQHNGDDSELVAQSGSNINHAIIDDGEETYWTGIGNNGGIWKFNDEVGALLLNEYEGTYNFGGFAQAITSIMLVGDNKFSYTLSAMYDEPLTLFGGENQLAKIATDIGAGSLEISVDMSNVDKDKLGKKLIVISGAANFEIDEATVKIFVIGTNSAWTNAALEKLAVEGIATKAGESTVKMYNSALFVNVMSSYDIDADKVIGLNIATDKAEFTTSAIDISSASVAIKGNDVEVKGSEMVISGDAEFSEKLAVSNSTKIVANSVFAVKMLKVNQESSITVKSMVLGQTASYAADFDAGDNKAKINVVEDLVITYKSTFTNLDTLTVGGKTLVLGTLTNEFGTFGNNGDVLVPKAIAKAAAEGVISIDNSGATLGANAAMVKKITFTTAVLLDVDGIVDVNAEVTFTTKDTAETAAFVYAGELIPTADGKGYVLKLIAADLSTITVTYDSTKTPASTIGKDLTIGVTGNVTIGEEGKKNLVTNVNGAPVESLPDIGAVTANSGAVLKLTGGEIQSTGTVSVYTPFTVGEGAAFTGNLSAFDDVTVAGTMEGNIVSEAGTVALAVDSVMNGNITAKGGVAIDGTLTGDVTTTKNAVTILDDGKMEGKITNKDNVIIDGSFVGEIEISLDNGDEAKLTVDDDAKIIATLTYNSKYKAQSGDTSDTTGTAKMSFIGSAGFAVELVKGTDATTTTPGVPGYFSFEASPVVVDEDNGMVFTLNEGRFLVDTTITMPEGTTFAVGDGTTFEIVKNYNFNVKDAALMISDNATALIDLGSDVPEYGTVLYVMSFHMSAGFTAYSNAAFALSNCDEGSTLTLGETTTINTAVEIKAGVTIVVDDVTLTFNGKDVKMNDDASIMLLGDGKVIFKPTGDDSEDLEAGDEITYYTVSGTIVYGDNSVVFNDVRFNEDSAIVGVAATSTEDAKIKTDLQFYEGTATIASGTGTGTIILENGMNAKTVDPAPEYDYVYATFVIGIDAVFDAVKIQDMPEIVKYKKDSDNKPVIDEVVFMPTIVGVEGTLNLLDTTAVKGVYAGLGKVTLAEGKSLTVDSAVTPVYDELCPYPGSLNLSVVDTTDEENGYHFTFVTTEAKTGGDGLKVTAGTITIEGEKFNAMKISGDFKLGAIMATTAAVLDGLTVSETATIFGDAVYVTEKSYAKGYVGAGVIYMDDSPFKELDYQVTFKQDEYTVYTQFTTIDLDEITDFSIEKGVVTTGAKKVDLGGKDVNIVIGEKAIFKITSIVIIGTPATVLGDEGSSIVGKVIITDKNYLVAYADVDLSMAEIVDEGGNDAVFSKLDIEDTLYAAIFAQDLDEDTVVLSKADASIIPEIVGYNFTAWLNYNGDAKAKIGETNAYADARAVYLTVIVKYVAGVDYYMNGMLFNVYDIPTDVPFGSYFTAKISDTTKYQGNPLINGEKTVCVYDDMELVASGVTPIPEPTPEPVVGDSGLSLTDILLIVLVILIAIMVVILVLRLNRS